MTNYEIVLETNLSYPLFKRGKARDVHDLGTHIVTLVHETKIKQGAS